MKRRSIPWSLMHRAHSAALVRIRRAFKWCDDRALPGHALRMRAWSVAAGDGYLLLCRLESACGAARRAVLDRIERAGTPRW